MRLLRGRHNTLQPQHYEFCPSVHPFVHPSRTVTKTKDVKKTEIGQKWTDSLKDESIFG